MRTKTEKFSDLIKLFAEILYIFMIIDGILKDNYIQAIFFLLLLHFRWKDYEKYPTNSSKHD